ncbi:conserved phage C-terminal domain-containing protein [Catenibacterium mitsuokai]|uniref:conserved phage C-terminal domain-containing protein n=1 Tax=Catenibacterium mitsuokai TaxID=100886 RepID=UPI0022DFAC50|nr:conserved phage C-terminal domain-containing protein [Catenibacterium mitsuokai]
MATKRELEISQQIGDKTSDDCHRYSVKVARMLGHDVAAAALFQHLSFNISKNLNLGKTDPDGVAWYFASASDIVSYMPELTKKMVERRKDKLISKGLIMQSYQWKNGYTLTEEGWALSQCETASRGNKGKQKVTQKEEKVEVAPEVIEVIEYLNKEIGCNRCPSKKSNREGIEHWLSEGFSVEELKAVIDVKKEQWINDSKWKVYLRPETLFRKRFEGYLEEAREAGLVKTTPPIELTTEEIKEYVSKTNEIDYYKKDISKFTIETQEHIEACYEKGGEE